MTPLLMTIFPNNKSGQRRQASTKNVVALVLLISFHFIYIIIIVWCMCAVELYYICTTIARLSKYTEYI